MKFWQMIKPRYIIGIAALLMSAGFLVLSFIVILDFVLNIQITVGRYSLKELLEFLALPLATCGMGILAFALAGLGLIHKKDKMVYLGLVAFVFLVISFVLTVSVLVS